ncbi:MAG: hypothetical protein ACKVJQ_07950 [Alphaproteobacteria bacterium]|jgi:hypothetical protein
MVIESRQPKKNQGAAVLAKVIAAQKPNARSRKKEGGGGSVQIMVAIMFVLGMLLALPTMLVVTIGLLPTLVALVVDVRPGRKAAQSVGALNIAGITPFLVTLWTGQNDIVSAMKILTDAFAWLVIYSAAGGGWLLYLGMPTVSSIFMQMTAKHKITNLEARQKN